MGGNQQEGITRSGKDAVSYLFTIRHALYAEVVDSRLVTLLFQNRLRGDVGPCGVGIVIQCEGATFTILLKDKATLPHIGGSSFGDGHCLRYVDSDAVGTEVDDREVAQAVGRQHQAEQHGV